MVYNIINIILIKYRKQMLRILWGITLIVIVIGITEPTNFDYSSHGDNWDKDCAANGTNQSPIDLSNSSSMSAQSSYFFADFGQSTGTAYFLNTTIYINTSSQMGYSYTQLINSNAVPFKATQIRFRMHAEHKINSDFYPLEIQVFHTELYQTSRNFRLALSVFFQESQEEDPFLKEIINAYQRSNGTISEEVSFNLDYLFSKNTPDDFIFYLGSVTIPPCSNGRLNWLVSTIPHSMTTDQANKLKDILSQGQPTWDGNYRKIQPRNGNKVALRHISSIKQI